MNILNKSGYVIPADWLSELENPAAHHAVVYVLKCGGTERLCCSWHDSNGDLIDALAGPVMTGLEERKRAFLAEYAALCKRFALEIEPSARASLVEQRGLPAIDVLVTRMLAYFGVNP